LLVSIGAFRFTGKSKKRLLWEANFLQKKNKQHVPASQSLFNTPPVQFTLPELIDQPIDDLYDQIEILGFPLTNPFALVDDDPARYVASSALDTKRGKQVSVLAYFIASKHILTKHKDVMFFGTFVDSELNWVDTVHFPDTVKAYPLQTTGFYRITGRVIAEFDVDNLEVQKMIKIGYKKRSYAQFS